MPPKKAEYEIIIDGQRLEEILEDFTFKEHNEYRDAVRELSGEEDSEPELAAGRDKFPVVAWLLRRRSNADLTLEEVMDTLKLKDVVHEKNGRPTKASKAPA